MPQKETSNIRQQISSPALNLCEILMESEDEEMFDDADDNLMGQQTPAGVA